MCFFGSSQKYESPPAPAVTPAPVTPTAQEMAKANAAIPSSVASQSPGPITIAAEEKRRKIATVRYGMMSTIKTSPQGVTGTGANLSPIDTGKKTTLGS